MRNFDMHGKGHGRGLGRHRMYKGIVIGAVLFVVLGLLVMSLWNALLPAITGVKAIGFWQALGILLLSRILLVGWVSSSMFGAHRRMHAQWMNMTPNNGRPSFSSVGQDLVVTVIAGGTMTGMRSEMITLRKRRKPSERYESR